MYDLKFQSCKTDPDVWYCPATTKKDSSTYYEYVLIYVDLILTVSESLKNIMETLSGLYRLKEDPTTGKTYDRPSRYLRANIGNYHFDDDVKKPRWFILSHTYVKQAIKTCEEHLDKQGLKLKTKVSATLPAGYRPELDISEELNDKGANQFQELIGILRWSIELGQIDIASPVALLSSFLDLPTRGHLEAVYHVFAYLKLHAQSKIVFDNANIDWDNGKFTDADWADFYPDAAEDLPPNAPEPRGKLVQINCLLWMRTTLAIR
jgi:hypothetical protein